MPLRDNACHTRRVLGGKDKVTGGSYGLPTIGSSAAARRFNRLCDCRFHVGLRGRRWRWRAAGANSGAYAVAATATATANATATIAGAGPIHDSSHAAC